MLKVFNWSPVLLNYSKVFSTNIKGALALEEFLDLENFFLVPHTLEVQNYLTALYMKVVRKLEHFKGVLKSFFKLQQGL